MQALIDVYAKECKETAHPMTVVGLALALNIDKQTLYNYEKYDGFSPVLKKAKSLCEDNILTRMLTGKSPAAPAIFVLKNHYNYADKLETTVNVTHNIAESLEERRLLANKRVEDARKLLESPVIDVEALDITEDTGVEV